jgi:hypothetical protein
VRIDRFFLFSFEFFCAKSSDVCPKFWSLEDSSAKNDLDPAHFDPLPEVPPSVDLQMGGQERSQQAKTVPPASGADGSAGVTTAASVTARGGSSPAAAVAAVAPGLPRSALAASHTTASTASSSPTHGSRAAYSMSVSSSIFPEGTPSSASVTRPLVDAWQLHAAPTALNAGSEGAPSAPAKAPSLVAAVSPSSNPAAEAAGARAGDQSSAVPAPPPFFATGSPFSPAVASLTASHKPVPLPRLHVPLQLYHLLL